MCVGGLRRGGRREGNRLDRIAHTQPHSVARPDRALAQPSPKAKRGAAEVESVAKTVSPEAAYADADDESDEGRSGRRGKRRSPPPPLLRHTINSSMLPSLQPPPPPLAHHHDAGSGSSSLSASFDGVSFPGNTSSLVAAASHGPGSTSSSLDAGFVFHKTDDDALGELWEM